MTFNPQVCMCWCGSPTLYSGQTKSISVAAFLYVWNVTSEGYHDQWSPLLYHKVRDNILLREQKSLGLKSQWEWMFQKSNRSYGNESSREQRPREQSPRNFRSLDLLFPVWIVMKSPVFMQFTKPPASFKAEPFLVIRQVLFIWVHTATHTG